MNTARIKAGLKKAIRDWNDKHPRDQITAEKMSRAPFWGKAAKTNFYRLSQHVKGLDYAPKPTRELLDYLFPPTLGELAVRRAETKIGVHEVGTTNSGVWVDKFLKAVYLGPGYAWCAAFVTWCLAWALLQKGWVKSWEEGRDLIRDLMYQNPAGCPQWLRAARERHTVRGFRVVLVAPEHARAGDFVIFWGGQHIGLLRKAGWLLRIWRRTVEGNTADNDTGDQANGGEVVNKKRSRGDITCYGRIVKVS